MGSPFSNSPCGGIEAGRSAVTRLSVETSGILSRRTAVLVRTSQRGLPGHELRVRFGRREAGEEADEDVLGTGGLGGGSRRGRPSTALGAVCGRGCGVCSLLVL